MTPISGKHGRRAQALVDATLAKIEALGPSDEQMADACIRVCEIVVRQRRRAETMRRATKRGRK